MKSKYSFLVLLVLISTYNSEAQNSYNNAYEQIGISIPILKFNKLVDSFTNVMLRNDSMNIPEYIIVVRLSNTIIFNDIDKKEKYGKFEKLFFSKYSNLAAKALNATLSKGMSYYSKEYDLHIGGYPYENSKYKLIK